MSSQSTVGGGKPRIRGTKPRTARATQGARRKATGLFLSYVSPLGWSAAALGLIALSMFFAFGWHEMLSLGLVALVMVIAAIAMSLGNTSFAARVDMSRHRVRVGDDVDVSVTVENPGLRPTTNAMGDLPIGPSHERFSIPMLAPHQAKHTDIQFKAVSRAVLKVGPLHIRKGDPFGLIRHEKSLADEITLFIHPITVRIKPLDSGAVRDLEGQPSDRIVDDDLDFFGLREYRPGDDVRNVHWLSSSKTNTLMIRQYEATRRTDTSITLDVNPNDYVSSQEFELAVCAHASVGAQCLIQDRPLTAHAGTEHKRHRQGMSFLDSCSAIQPDPTDNANLSEGAMRYSPNASCYCFTVGSLKPVEQVKRIAFALPHSATCVVLRIRAGATKSIEYFNDFTMATIGTIDDLQPIFEVLS